MPAPGSSGSTPPPPSRTTTRCNSRAQQRWRKGLAFQFNYTWSKCLTNNQGYYGRYGNAGARQTTADVAFQSYVYNVGAGLRPVRCGRRATMFSGYLNYDLPFGHGRTFGKNAGKAVNAILGDWRYDTIVSVHGGLPISMIQFGNDPTGRVLPAAAGLPGAFGGDAVQELRRRRLRLVRSDDDGDSGARQTRHLSAYRASAVRA